jgi:chromosome segregation ATPase
MPPAELERKVRRLDNDVQAIYELLATISATQTRHGNRLDELDARFDGIDTRLDGIDRRLDGHDKRFDGIDARLDGHDKRFDGMDAKLDEILGLVRPR